MTRETKNPVRRAAPGRHTDDAWDHPAFGVIELNSSSWSIGGTRLAGSDLAHTHTMSIKIYRGYMERSFGVNAIRHDGRIPIAEVELSEAQWARFVSSQGWGGGTPCTIRCARDPEAAIDEPPMIGHIEAPQETAMREARDKAAKVIEQVDAACKSLRAILDRPGSPRKGDIEAAVHGLEISAGHFAGNAEFYLKQFADVIDKTVQDGKTELEAFVNHVAVNTGLEALRSGASPVMIESTVNSAEPL